MSKDVCFPKTFCVKVYLWFSLFSFFFLTFLTVNEETLSQVQVILYLSAQPSSFSSLTIVLTVILKTRSDHLGPLTDPLLLDFVLTFWERVTQKLPFSAKEWMWTFQTHSFQTWEGRRARPWGSPPASWDTRHWWSTCCATERHLTRKLKANPSTRCIPYYALLPAGANHSFLIRIHKEKNLCYLCRMARTVDLQHFLYFLFTKPNWSLVLVIHAVS